MIKIRTTEYVIDSPDKLNELKYHNIQDLVISEKQNDIYFIVPKRIMEIANSRSSISETNHLLQAYKAGFLKLFLSKLYPEKNADQIYDMIRVKYQMFFSKRKIRSCNTDFKKNKHLFW